MKINLTLLFLTLLQTVFSQQYDTVVIEEENIDQNNIIYKPGNLFVYDYEIIQDGVSYKLKNNSGMFAGRDYELVPMDSDNVGIDKIHLLVQQVEDVDRTNKNQTQISYLQEPVYASYSSTGVVENENNVWIHPIRAAFFNALQTAPFPYVKYPLEIGSQWTDQMQIGQGWGGKAWGEWEGQIILSYDYKVTKKVMLQTEIGKLECYIIESVAKSEIGETKLKSYFSEECGFVRLEYELMNNLKVNKWLVETNSGVEINDLMKLFKSK